MKKSIITLSITIVFGVSLNSCNKEKEEIETPVSATISVVEPSLNDTIFLGQELHIEGTIVGTDNMHGYVISARNSVTDSVLFTANNDIHAAAYNFHEHWVNNVSDTTLVTVKVDVTKDHEGNHEIKEVNVVCLPN